MRQQLRHVLGSHRTAEQITLQDITSVATQHRLLRRCLDSFGQDVQPQTTGQIDDPGHDGFVLRVVAQAHDEGAIDRGAVHAYSSNGRSW